MSWHRRKPVVARVLPHRPRHRKDEILLAFDPEDLKGDEPISVEESEEVLAEVKRRRPWVELVAARMEQAAVEAERLRHNNSFGETFERAGLLSKESDDDDA